MMKPTVGRIVHFYDQTIELRANNGVGPGPYAAIITQVFPDDFADANDPDTPTTKPRATEGALVNLHVILPNSYGKGEDPERTNVRQVPNDIEYAPGCYWMEPPRV